MIWRLLAIKSGPGEFASRIKAVLQDGSASLGEIRAAFPEQKEFLDYAFDQATDTNLQAGLPQQGQGEWRVALRNAGSVDVTVDVEAVLENGQRMNAPATVRSKNFGEVVFKTPTKVRRVEIDREKLYPQTDFSDDIAPRELTDSDPLLAVKRQFDKQEWANAEKTARQVLADWPRFDDVRILLARSLLALGRTADAEKEFRAALDEKLPSTRTIGWTLVGLADIAAKAGQNDQAVKLATEALRADAEYGASLAARTIRNRAGNKTSEPSVATYFDQWDKAAAANQKAQLDALVLPGEASRFSSGVAGQTAQWKTEITHVDMIDPNTAVVEANMAIKLLNRDPETGLAVYRLQRSGGAWKLASVDVFEVR
jgi:tetratricopeptide (TPR) repeat protein